MWVLNPKISFLTRSQTHRRKGVMKKGDRDWRDMPTGQEMPGFAGSYLSEALSEAFSPRRNQPGGTLIFNFWPLGIWRINLCFFKPPSLWSFMIAVLGN